MTKLKNESKEIESSLKEKEDSVGCNTLVSSNIQEQELEKQIPVPVKKRKFFLFSKKGDTFNNQEISRGFQTPYLSSLSPDNISLSENMVIPKRCPKCNKKIKKSKVYLEGKNFVQLIKCKNNNCDYQNKFNVNK